MAAYSSTAVFGLDRLRNYRQLLKNVSTYGRKRADSHRASVHIVMLQRQNFLLKTVVIFLAGLATLVIALLLMGNTWTVFLGGGLSGVVIGVIGNKMTDLLSHFMADRV